MTYSWDKEPVFCFTSDIDWASESIIEYSHNVLSGNDLKLTYFVTHSSPFLNDLNEQNKVRLLIHPNFLPDSSHGNSFTEVIDYCLNLVPNADGFRSHRYFEVNDIMDDLEKRGFRFVSNHCTRCETHIKPLIHRSGLLSIPIFLEDGGYLLMDPDLNFNNLIPKLRSPGLKVINFHPAHMAFNTPDFDYTRSIKDSMSRESWNNLDKSDLQNLENKQKLGIRTIIQQIIDFAFDNNCKVLSMNEIYQEHQMS
jgi:hypothetical protein